MWMSRGLKLPFVQSCWVEAYPHTCGASSFYFSENVRWCNFDWDREVFFSFLGNSAHTSLEKIVKIFWVDCLCSTVFLLKDFPQRRRDGGEMMMSCWCSWMNVLWVVGWKSDEALPGLGAYNTLLKYCFLPGEFVLISTLSLANTLIYSECNTPQVSFAAAHFSVCITAAILQVLVSKNTVTVFYSHS